MRKFIFLFVIVFMVLGEDDLMAQKRDTTISASINGNIFKPKLSKSTEASDLQVPQGFTIQTFAEGLEKPRMMAVTEDGTVYVTRRQGDVRMLKDTNDDGQADVNETVLTLDQVHGIAVKENELYLVTVNEVYKTAIQQDGQLGEPQLLMENLPDGGQHPNRTIEFGPDDKMYISVGSTCNACKETSEESATLIVAEADGSGREIYAKGLRNTIGFDWHPDTEVLYGLDHGIDWLGDTVHKEELNRLEEGNDYGWPYVYEDGKPNPADQPEEMSYEEYAAQTTAPLLTLPAHSAPLDMLFYDGEQFPENYHGQAIATLHGSWNRAEPSGYKVVMINFDENGEPSGYEDFITGFLVNGDQEYIGRVCGLAVGKDGSLFISDDAGGVIYKLSYEDVGK
ncbi:PQQ-dependent sugar dehydrogenase [Catalinimonas niigatensis]|uniref:PQQ-dependent sugar dehydrogenase n=1 Tax=Catalinimonas niigatensis TaxID=1397264 RepID=UPI002665D3D1|nr:PQQ-dependent sugar dehydrogenase [Catalinimonas niigatensis]WPP53568.1 PQQ-dependent sugar dehydrogenase [Catalinimonas niigatensis]